MYGPLRFTTYVQLLTRVVAQIMEFIKGRIITDTNLEQLSPSDRRKA